MSRQTVYLGLGSNLSAPLQQLQTAVQAISRLAQTCLLNTSSAYLSKPMGPQDQPDYVNAVVALSTQLDPYELLDALQTIEAQQGRRRNGQQWGPRTLDIDILLFGQLVIQEPHLTIPHYGMRERAFVLYPLAEIATDLRLPSGEALKSVLEKCPRQGLKKLDQTFYVGKCDRNERLKK